MQPDQPIRILLDRRQSGRCAADPGAAGRGRKARLRARRGRAARRRHGASARTRKFDIVLVDLSLADASGLETVTRLRQQPSQHPAHRVERPCGRAGRDRCAARRRAGLSRQGPRRWSPHQPGDPLRDRAAANRSPAHRGQGEGRSGQPRQDRIPRQYEPRAPDALECRHRLLRDIADEDDRAPRPSPITSTMSGTFTSAACISSASSTTFSISRRSRSVTATSRRSTSISTPCSLLRRLVGERAATAGLELVIETPPEPPQLQADEQMVKQMLLNLLSNAIKFTPKGAASAPSPGSTRPARHSSASPTPASGWRPRRRRGR